MFKRLFLLLLVALLLYSPAFAAVAIQQNGNEQGVATTINVRGIGGTGDGSTFNIGIEPEKVTVGDDLVTADTGKVTVYVPSPLHTTGTFNLPGATVGLRYQLVQGSIGQIRVDPQTSDTIRLLTLHAGDKVFSPGTTTGDSITLICDTAQYWSIEGMRGVWTDGGA